MPPRINLPPVVIDSLYPTDFTIPSFLRRQQGFSLFYLSCYYRSHEDRSFHTESIILLSFSGFNRTILKIFLSPAAYTLCLFPCMFLDCHSKLHRRLRPGHCRSANPIPNPVVGGDYEGIAHFASMLAVSMLNSKLTTLRVL